MTIGNEKECAFVVFTRFRNRCVAVACLRPVTKHFMGKCFVHDTRFHLSNTLTEVIVTFLGDSWEEGIVSKHGDRFLIRRNRLPEVIRIEVRVCIAFLITFRFGGFVVGTSFKEFTHQLDEMELR